MLSLPNPSPSPRPSGHRVEWKYLLERLTSAAYTCWIVSLDNPANPDQATCTEHWAKVTLLNMLQGTGYEIIEAAGAWMGAIERALVVVPWAPDADRVAAATAVRAAAQARGQAAYVSLLGTTARLTPVLDEPETVLGLRALVQHGGNLAVDTPLPTLLGGRWGCDVLGTTPGGYTEVLTDEGPRRFWFEGRIGGC